MKLKCLLYGHDWSPWVYEGKRASAYNWASHCQECHRYQFSEQTPKGEFIPDYDAGAHPNLKPGDVIPIPIAKTEDRLGVFVALLEKADLPSYERRMWIERWGCATYTEDARRKQFEDDFTRPIKR